MHSGLLLSGWLVIVVGLQVLPASALGACVALSLVLALLAARARAVRLLRRVRVLLGAIVLLFAWFTPGEAVLLDWPVLSPTREGLVQALEHGGRLIAVVCWVALLLERLPTERLVSGLYALVRPCRMLGLSAERIALRLLLVLRYVDAGTATAGGWKAWLVAADEGNDAGDEGPVRLYRERFGVTEWVVVAVLAVSMGWWLW